MSVSAACTKLAALATSLLMVSGSVQSAAATTPATVTESAVRMGTYNLVASMDVAPFRDNLHAFLDHVDVAGLQEVNSRDKEAVIAGLPGWSYYRPERDRGEQNPVLWDSSRFTLVNARSVHVAGDTYIGDELPGREPVLKAHFVSVVRLADRRTGRRISVVNGHLPPGAVQKGRRVPDRPRVFERYVEELARVAEVVADEAEWGYVLAAGDFNVGWVADESNRRKRLPFATFKRMGLRSMWATERPTGYGTHSKSLIDQVFAAKRAASASVLRGIDGSDHYPAVASYYIPSA